MAANIKGIDISEYNGTFNAASAISQGAKYVIIRCGYGSDDTSQDDKQFAANVARCEAAGLPYGLYLYSYANTTAKATSEAAHAIRLAKTCNPTWGVWFDAEDSSMPSVPATLAEICNIFCNAVKAAGYYTGIYANASWLKNRLTDSSLKKWPKWVAHFTAAAQPDYNSDDVVLWQYQCPPNDAASPTAYDWNRTMCDFEPTEGGGTLSRVLKIGKNQVTNPYQSGSHDGIDIVKDYYQLDTIVAHSAGTVTYVQKGYGNNTGSTGNASYGNLVKIKHPNGYFTLYAHLDIVADGITVGTTVTKGQTIGVMGNSGNSYGGHLHFELRNANDIRIDPTPYINADLPGLITETKEEDMTKAETQALIDSAVKPLQTQLTAANAELVALKKTYAYIEDVPEWYRDAVQYYIDKDVIKGKEIRNGKPFIDLTATECRMLTVMYRAETDTE